MGTSVQLEAPGHADEVLKELQVLQREQQLCDVRLTTDTGGVSAHKVVLMATSPSLRSRLSAGDLSYELIHFDNIPLSMLDSVVQFMYTGKLTVESYAINQLLKFCEDLELVSAVDLLKGYIKNVIMSCVLHTQERDSKMEKDASDSPNESFLKEIEKNGRNTRSEKSGSTSRKSNRRVKQTPKKRTAKQPSAAEKDIAPDKLVKLSSDVLIQKVLEEGFIKEEPVEQRGRGRPRKNTLRAPTTPAKSSKASTSPVKKSKTPSPRKRKAPKPKYESKKIKQEKEQDDNKSEGEKKQDDYNSDGEKIYDYGQLAIERGKSGRAEVNSLKAVINTKDTPTTLSSDILLTEIKEPKKEVTFDDEYVEMKVEEPISGVKEEVKKEKKVPKKRVWKKRKKQPCSMCDKVLSTKKRLVFHEYSQHGLEYDKNKYKMFHCPVEGCTHISSSRNNMRTHTRSRHATERPHVCEFCGKSFKLQNVLATHLNLHTGAKVYECKKCGERFNQHSGLDVHIKRHHMGESSWGELCHLCSEKFLQKSELSWHLFRVHNQPLPDRYKAYTCDKCNFVTKSCQDFERHKNAHEGIKEWMCNICSKGCATKSELKRHVMYHGEKSFKCTFENCTYACVDDLGLKKHIQLMHTHKHFKPYVCSICKYKTGVKGNLDKHIRQVHNLEVVSKHTVPLKMKYKDFQQGDIITKDGKLVVSVEDRKNLYKEELMLLRGTVDEKPELEKEVEKSVRSISRNKNKRPSVQVSSRDHESSRDHGSSSANTSPNFGVQQSEKFHDSHGIPESNSFQYDLGATMSMSSHVYHPPTMAPHMALGLGHDLRMGMASHLANPHMFEEGLQGYVHDNSVERVDIMNN